MSFKKSLGKSFVLIIIILILLIGGSLWLDYLGVISVKSTFSPLYKLLGKTPQTSVTATQSNPLSANLDEDRLNKIRESLNLQSESLDKREADAQALENQLTQTATELAEREKNQEEREKNFDLTVKQYDDKDKNIEQIATWLNSMAPANAVAQLNALDDQTVIDVLRKVEEIAARDGSSSQASYWISLMDPKRSAEIQRKMVNKPVTLE